MAVNALLVIRDLVKHCPPSSNSVKQDHRPASSLAARRSAVHNTTGALPHPHIQKKPGLHQPAIFWITQVAQIIAPNMGDSLFIGPDELCDWLRKGAAYYSGTGGGDIGWQMRQASSSNLTSKRDAADEYRAEFDTR